jgi:hypothetical protein
MRASDRDRSTRSSISATEPPVRRNVTRVYRLTSITVDEVEIEVPSSSAQGEC